MRRTIGTALAALALAGGGCGDGDEDDGEGVAKAELGSRAGEICNARKNDLDAIRRDIASVKRPVARAQSARFARELQAVVARAGRELRALEPPRALRADWDAFLAVFDAKRELLGRVAARLDVGDESVLADSPRRIEALTRRGRTLAREFGAKGCADLAGGP